MHFESDMAWSTPTQIFIKGHPLDDLIGTVDLGGMLFLLLAGRQPTSEELRMTNAVLVALVEHGMTPSAMAARLTWLGAPESTQGAVASGLLGVGSRLVGPVDEVARTLQEAVAGLRRDGAVQLPAHDVDFYSQTAEAIVADFAAKGTPVPGIGHPVHKPEDPRTVKLTELAAELRMQGPHLCLQQAIRHAAGERWNRHFPINVTGAIGAVVSDMGFPWRIARGFAVVSRCVGLVGHLHEEIHHPIARALAEDTERRTSPVGEGTTRNAPAASSGHEVSRICDR